MRSRTGDSGVSTIQRAIIGAHPLEAVRQVSSTTRTRSSSVSSSPLAAA
jgi:hypothetical protein